MNTKDQLADQQAEKPKLKRRLRRWIIPVLIIALAAGNIIRLRMSSDLDGMIKNMQSFLTLVVSVPLLSLWSTWAVAPAPFRHPGEGATLQLDSPIIFKRK